MKSAALIVTSGVTPDTTPLDPLRMVGDVSAVHRLIRTFWQGGVDFVVLVSASGSNKLEKHVTQMGAICLKQESGREMLDFAKTGIHYLAEQCDRILMTPVDIPLFTAQTVKTMLACTESLAKPVCGGKHGHPLLIDKPYFQTILNYTGTDGVRGAIRKLPCIQIEVDDKGVLVDVNKQSAYDDVLAKHKQQQIHYQANFSLLKETPFFDASTAQLLQLIENTGSVRTACQQMGVSYSKGWKMIGMLEDQLGEALILRQQGGAYGGSAQLTAAATSLLQAYRQFESESKPVLDALYRKCFEEWLF